MSHALCHVKASPAKGEYSKDLFSPPAKEGDRKAWFAG